MSSLHKESNPRCSAPYHAGIQPSITPRNKVWVADTYWCDIQEKYDCSVLIQETIGIKDNASRGGGIGQELSFRRYLIDVNINVTFHLLYAP